MTYQSALEHVRSVKAKLGNHWNAIRPEEVPLVWMSKTVLKQVLISPNTPQASCVVIWQSMMPIQIHPIPWLLAWIYRPAKDDCQQKNTLALPANATSTYQAGWLLHCVLNSGPLPDQSHAKKNRRTKTH